MSELVAFLTARLDEDEAVARAATGESWEQTNGATERTQGRVVAWGLTAVAAATEPQDATHVARHDPARVLREVTAKRAILDGLRDAEAVVARIGPDLTAPGDAAEWANYHAWHAAAEAAAAVFCDHPDFQEQWR